MSENIPAELKEDTVEQYTENVKEYDKKTQDEQDINAGWDPNWDQYAWFFGVTWDLDNWSTWDSIDIVELTGDDEQYAFLYNFFLTYQDELFSPNEPLCYNDIWLRPESGLDSRQHIILKAFPTGLESLWKLSLYSRNIDDDNESEFIVILESNVIPPHIAIRGIILIDDRTHSYALLDVLRSDFRMDGDLQDTYLGSFAKEHRGKIVNFRSKDAINIVAFSHSPAKSFFGIDFYILEIRGGKIKTIFDYNNLYIDAYNYYYGGVFESAYQRAVNMYKDTTGDSSVDNLGVRELRLIDYAMPSFEDRDNDGSIEIIIEGTENLLKAKDEQVNTSTFYPEDWEVLMPIKQYKKIYTWDEATEQYILQSEAGTEYVNLD
jgi:hypothetical protein